MYTSTTMQLQRSDAYSEVTMSHSTSLQVPAQAGMARRSSLFEVPAHFKPVPCGSSHMSFACDPRIDEEGNHGDRTKKVQYENTYQMEPPGKFKSDTVKKIIREVLETNLAEKTYDPTSCSLLAKSLSHDIKQQVKELDFKRYKLVSLVTIGEKRDHDVRMGSRCVWDTQWDTYSSATYENASLYAIGVVYGMYYE